MYRQWHLSHHQLRDQNGEILAGAKAYFYLSDATTPITVYQDYDLTQPHTWPVVANGIGVFPLVFLDEDNEFYRQSITDADDLLVTGTDLGTMPIAGPPETIVTEVAGDETRLIQTGMTVWMPQSGTIANWVRANGRTIGSASSLATELASATAEELYLYLWGNLSDAVCPVSGGRGASAAADFSANKPMGLPDLRFRSPIGLEAMGNAASGRASGATFATGSDNEPGSVGGAALHTLTEAELAVHDHDATSSSSSPVTDTHTHSYVAHTGSNQITVGAGPAALVTETTRTTGTTNGGSITVTTTTTTDVLDAGSGNAHNNMQPFILGTWYIKL
jgi:microcystin-dependent protein